MQCFQFLNQFSTDCKSSEQADDASSRRGVARSGRSSNGRHPGRQRPNRRRQRPRNSARPLRADPEGQFARQKARRVERTSQSRR